ncbi:MAG TPA: 3-phosphoserine/phosphohydroxythreonine transaminase [Sandaracinaceae bacterium LLY-WYZ-13_1]|nr:3-phosphoserine/phosphohydroxythreonine transaminase [Sandaracinaceae bacterium LLY-WYZ-13_1]
MSHRVMNFFPGPATLPLAALERAREELLDFDGTGMSIMEHSHRGAAYEGVHREALSLLRELIGIGDDHHVLLLQGGARQQFAMLPYNLLPDGATADYVLTGNWSLQARSEAEKLGANARVAASTEAEGFVRVPTQDELDLDPSAAYLHITSNNTLYGTQWATYPDTGDVPLLADMTSDLLSRPLDVSRFAAFYAGAQKNVGPSGVTVVVIRKDLVEKARTDRPAVWRYQSFVDKDSLWNTPPTFAIYMLRNTLAALKEWGGAEGLEKRNREKAELLYGFLDEHGEFFRSPVEKASRSTMNAVFRLPSEDLEKRFVAEAAEKDMVGLKGHRKVGGIRVSMYNAVERAWIERLLEFMSDFKGKHG